MYHVILLWYHSLLFLYYHQLTPTLFCLIKSFLFVLSTRSLTLLHCISSLFVKSLSFSHLLNLMYCIIWMSYQLTLFHFFFIINSLSSISSTHSILSHQLVLSLSFGYLYMLPQWYQQVWPLTEKLVTCTYVTIWGCHGIRLLCLCMTRQSILYLLVPHTHKMHITFWHGVWATKDLPYIGKIAPKYSEIYIW